MGSRICCRFQRGLKRKALALIKKLRKAKKEVRQRCWRNLTTNKGQKDGKPASGAVQLTRCRHLLPTPKQAPGGEKPEPVRTHLRNMIVIPEMIGSVVGVYNGKTFNQVRWRCGPCAACASAAARGMHPVTACTAHVSFLRELCSPR